MNTAHHDLAASTLQLVGGKDNIVKLTRCVTRLRFSVKDKSLVRAEEFANLSRVAGTQWFGDQFQVIIGAEVDDVYEAVCALAGYEPELTVEVDDEGSDDRPVRAWYHPKSIGNAILAYTAPTMTAVLPLLMAASLFKMTGSILGPTILNVISDTSDLYLTLDFVYAAFFYFLPVFLGYSASNTLKINPIYGIFLGTLIIVPGFVSLAGERDSISMFGIPVPVGDYSMSFLPVMLGVLVLSFVLKFFKRIIPAVVATVFVPTFTVLVMTPVMFAVCAPLGTYLGNLIGSFFIMLAEANIVLSILGAVVLAMAFPYIVVSGMHGALLTFALAAFFSNGVESYLLPIMLGYNFAVFGVAFGVAFKYKNRENRSAALSYFITGFIGSISEPALYGVILRYKFAMKALLIVSAGVGLIVGIFQPGVYALTAASVFTFWAPWPPGGAGNVLVGMILMLGALIGGAVVGYLWKSQDADFMVTKAGNTSTAAMEK